MTKLNSSVTVQEVNCHKSICHSECNEESYIGYRSFTFVQDDEEYIMALPFLQTLGLTQNEADLYELLVRRGELPAWKILQEIELPRATAYKSLYSLEKKGLVTKRDVGKTLHFRPEPPTKILELAESQYKALDRARKDAQSFLPELISQYTFSIEKPIVRSFGGVDGIKKAHLEILAEKKDIRAYVAINEELDDTQLNDFWPKYYAIRRRDKIFARVITPATKPAFGYKKLDKKEYRETRLVPAGKFPFTIEKNIVGNKVAFFSHEAGKLVATIIENKAIAEAEVAAFELAWEKAGEYDKSLG